jgi:hypothetical protein
VRANQRNCCRTNKSLNMTQAEQKQLAADKAKVEKIATDKLAAEQKQAAEKAEADKLAAEPKSEKLTEIRGKIEAGLDAIDATKDRKEKLKLNMELFKLQSEETAEIANIRKAEQDMVIAEKRNQRAKLYYDAVDLVVAMVNEHNKPEATLESKQAASDAAKTAGEKVVNELLAGFKGVSTVKTVATNGATTGGEKGATTKEILDLFIANRAAGMNDTDNKKALVNAGHKVGTIWGIVDKYKKEFGAVS